MPLTAMMYALNIEVCVSYASDHEFLIEWPDSALKYSSIV